MPWTLGVDVGGTFTDFYAFDGETGAVHVHKIASTPSGPAQAVLTGLKAMAATHNIDLAQVTRISHGTTVATNALIQGKGSNVALVTTKGFRDLLEIGRQIRPHMFDFQMDYPTPLIPRERRFEAAERMLSKGTVRQALEADEMARVISEVRDCGADACAICFLFAFVNPSHESALKQAMRAALPDLDISISSEIQPEFREYERLSTTVLNAYLQPIMSRYMREFEEGLAAATPNAALGINQSAGGLMSPSRARELPIRTALSGPAAGAIGAIHTAGLAGEANVITLDMGGTSADVCLIRQGEAEMTYDRWIEGYPARLASVDINAVGAGGGSIAWFDRDGLMKVGPISAGAEPGPACYGLGGIEPTVTDANLVLGRLSPEGLLGGGMPMDIDAARRSLEPAADRLDLSIENTAQGVIDIVVANMVRALRAISVERGHDPRDFVLLPFGGAGALHASDVARALGIAKFVVPLAPGILCAQGLVVSDLRESFVRSALTRVGDAELPRIRSILDELDRAGNAWLVAEHVAEDSCRLEVSLDMRYVGQNYELSVDLDSGALSNLNVKALAGLFFAEHDRAYGYNNPEDPVEIVNFRLTAISAFIRPPVPSFDEIDVGARPNAAGRRPVYFGANDPLATPVFSREALKPGHEIGGPAIIEQLDATTILHPADRLTVDAAGNLIVEIGQ